MNPTTETSTPDPMAPSRHRGRVFAAVAAFAAFGLGLAAGGPDTEATSAAPVEAVTETATEPAEVVTEQAEAETVEVVPQACLDALDAGEAGFDLSADAMGAASDGFFAAADFDIAGLEQAADDITAVNEQLDALAPTWNSNKAACRQAAS